MKIKLEMEVETTPKEVRETLGLPDVQAVQDRIIAKLEKRVTDAASEFDPTKLLAIFMPEGFRISDSVQKMVLDKLPKILKSTSKKD